MRGLNHGHGHGYTAAAWNNSFKRYFTCARCNYLSFGWPKRSVAIGDVCPKCGSARFKSVIAKTAQDVERPAITTIGKFFEKIFGVKKEWRWVYAEEESKEESNGAAERM